MSTGFIFISVAFTLLVLFAYLALRRRNDLRGLDQAMSALRSLDIEAFRNLVDPEEDKFLRTMLAPKEFNKIRRARVQAALAYVKALSDASLQFARVGGVAQRSADPAIAASGRQIANSATSLRMRTLEASASLLVSAAFPSFGPRPLPSLLEQYDRATHLLQNHQGLQRARNQAS
jgi:hypothetical protein